MVNEKVETCLECDKNQKTRIFIREITNAPSKLAQVLLKTAIVLWLKRKEVLLYTFLMVLCAFSLIETKLSSS